MKFIGESYSLYAEGIHKFGVTPQSFCENQNSVQNQDQDQDRDITLAEPPPPAHWLNRTFLLLRFAIYSAIQTRNSSKILEKK